MIAGARGAAVALVLLAALASSASANLYPTTGGVAAGSVSAP